MDFLKNIIFQHGLTTLDVQAGLTSAKTEVIELAKFAFNFIFVPLAVIGLAIYLVFNIVTAVKRHRGGEGYSANIGIIAGIILALVLVLSSTTWLWQMVAV